MVPEKYQDELLEQLESGVQLPDLVAESAFLVETLPRTQIKRLFDARAEWRERVAAIERLETTLHSAGLPLPPLETRERALVPHKLEALGRAVRICPRDDFADEEAWSNALIALLDVWSGAVAQTRRRGSLKIQLDPTHPDANHFDQLASRKELLSDLPTHRWQAIRRGERAGALSWELDPPLSTIRGHMEGIRDRIGATAGQRDVDSILDEMVISALPGTLQALLDRRAETDAIRSAVTQYQKLLGSVPLAAGRIGAVAISGNGARLGAVVLTEGDLPEMQEEIDGQAEDWLETLTALFSVAGVEQVAVPMTCPAKEILERTVKGLEDEDMEPLKVRVAALSEARTLLTDPPLSLAPVIASAVVLARRALSPADEWERVDPVSIGLADYQQDLNEDRLREALQEALGLFQLDRVSGAWSPPAPRPSARQRAAAKQRLNPMVKSMADLRPGMTLDGVITNITRFGAFVNVGLPDEGMIHISELSTEYVQSPSDVVSLGERVKARVLDVDPRKRRIALSLKPSPGDARPGEQHPSVGGGRNIPLDTRIRRGQGGDRGRRGGGPGIGRNAALQQLESLFKK